MSRPRSANLATAQREPGDRQECNTNREAERDFYAVRPAAACAAATRAIGTRKGEQLT
jgi:hypothetical protein